MPDQNQGGRDQLVRSLGLGTVMTGPDGKPGTYTQAQLLRLDHATLYRMRAANKDPVAQEMLANVGHRRFASEATRENPLLGLPIVVATPLYALANAAGLTSSRSPTSFAQVGHGLAGVGEDLKGAAGDAWEKVRGAAGGW